jgi:hypothetical protein
MNPNFVDRLLRPISEQKSSRAFRLWGFRDASIGPRYAGDPLVTERDGKFSLSTKGREAVSPMSDDIKLFEVDEINAIQCFDLIAFAPVDDADLNAARLRAPQFGGAIVIDLQLLTRAFAVNDRWVKTRR